MSVRRISFPLRFWRGLLFFFFYVKEVVLSSFLVAYDILTPRLYSRPGIIAVSLRALTDRQVLVLTNLVTMTPGTLSLDLSDDRLTLYIHHMHIPDPEALRLQIEKDYVRRVREIF
ncbi:MAG: Na+/H+ antiporter subunit E [Bacteroidota bacterium]|nr:Na+/H+ antiporter subunit E [Bacteroidota bacterium]